MTWSSVLHLADEQEISMTERADVPLWPDTVGAFYADRACSLRSAATRKTWGYTYRMLQRRHPGTAIGRFRTDDLVAFVTQRGWETPRWASATARNYRVALQSLFGWARHAARIPYCRCSPRRTAAYLRPHDLRRTLAGTLDARRMPLQDIRVVLRHDTIAATQAYLVDHPLRVRRRMCTFTIQL